MAGDPYSGLDADAWSRALREVRAQLPGMTSEAKALDAELKSGRRTLAQIEAEARRGARVGAAATRPAAPAPPASARAAEPSPQLAAKTRDQIALEEQYAQRLLARDKANKLLTRSTTDLARAQTLRDAALRADRAIASGAVTDPTGVGRNTAQNDALTQQRLINRLQPRVTQRTAALSIAEKDLAATEAELRALEAQRVARGQNLAIAREQLEVAIALRRAATLPPQRLLPAGGPLGGLPAPYVPPRYAGLPPGVPGPYSAFNRPQPQLPAGRAAPLQEPQRLLPSGLPPAQRLLGPGAIPPPDATRAYAEANREIARTQTSAARATGAFSTNLGRNQAILAASSTEMRKFGSLTTEFIGAAGRGAVTVRELGFQVSSTIGKFGGWLAAGSAVYGAFGAVQAMGKGAIDAQSGVSQLQRVVKNVDASDAIQSFRDLSSEFNLPIEDVTNASFEMGKVFDNQNESLEATRAILASIKVGELDVATSSRYLTSIIQAFNLPATEMTNVFDQINQAQNTFGIRIEDTLAGLAKSSGTFRAAGGDISSLLALITTARRATGQTGEVIGTALSRAPNFITKGANQKVIESYGLDPSKDIDELFEDAIQRARTLSGPKRQELAAALFGPQYGARIGTPLLGQADLYNKVKAGTSPAASEGSAQKELQSVLAQTSEQLSKVIVQLQDMGAGLADAGAFDALGGMLKLLNLTLTTANSIVSIFNKIPEPLRKAAIYAAQLAAVVALARRLNVGESFGGLQGGRAGRFLTRRDQTAFLYNEGLVQQRDVLSKEAESAAQRSVRQSLSVATADTGLQQERAAHASILTKYGAESEQAQISAQRVNAAEGALASAREQEVALMNRNREILQQSLIVQKQIDSLALQKGTAAERNAAATRLAAQHGVIIPTAVGPDAQRAAALAQLRLATQGGARPIEGRAPLSNPSYERLVYGGVGVVPDGAVIQKGTSALRDNITRYGVLAGTVRTGGEKVNDAARRASVNLRLLDRAAITGTAGSALGSLKKVGTNIAGFFSYFDAVLAGAFILGGSLASAIGSGNKAQELIDQETPTLDEFSQTQADLHEQSQQKVSILGKLGVPGFNDAQEAQDQTRAEELRRDMERNRQLQALVSPTPVNLAGEDTYVYEEDYERVLGLIRGGGTNNAKRAQVMIQSVRHNTKLTDEVQEALIADARNAVVDAAGIQANYNQIASAAGTDLAETISDLSDAFGTSFGDLGQRRELMQNALVQAAELMDSGDPAEVALASQALDDIATALDDHASSELEFALAFAKSQEERNAAYKNYLQATDPSKIAGAQDNLIDEQRVKMFHNRQVLNGLRADQRKVEANPFHGLLEDLGLGDNGIEKEIKATENEQRSIHQQIKSLREAGKEATRRLRLIRKEQQDARFEENQAEAEARAGLREGRANEGLPALRVALNAINQRVADAIKHYGRDSKEVLDLLGEQRDAREAIVDEQLALLQANNEFSQAGLTGEGNETSLAQAQIAGMQEQLAFMRAHPTQFSASEMRGLEAQIREAQVGLAQQIEDDAEEMAKAMYAIRGARAQAAGNEVGAARAQYQSALYEQRTADTPLEKRQAQEGVITQRAALRDAIFNRQLEDIEFQADIGKLTLQQQIRAYQGLLRTAEINRDQRRDLRRRIEQLKSEAESEAGSFDLSVGNIRLPTIYEIKRAIGEGGGGVNNNVTVNNAPVINVNGAQDPAGTAREVNRHIGGSNKAALRSAGII